MEEEQPLQEAMAGEGTPPQAAADMAAMAKGLLTSGRSVSEFPSLFEALHAHLRAARAAACVTTHLQTQSARFKSAESLSMSSGSH